MEGADVGRFGGGSGATAGQPQGFPRASPGLEEPSHCGREVSLLMGLFSSMRASPLPGGGLLMNERWPLPARREAEVGLEAGSGAEWTCGSVRLAWRFRLSGLHVFWSFVGQVWARQDRRIAEGASDSEITWQINGWGPRHPSCRPLAITLLRADL